MSTRLRSRRPLAPIVGGIGLLILASCAVTPDAPNSTQRAPVGTAQQALVDSVDDADTPEANAVVRLSSPYSNCTGTLITPQIVLTALHCIRVDTAPTCDITLPMVSIGLNRAQPEPGSPVPTSTWTRQGVAAVTAADDCLNRAMGRGTDVDLALVYLDRPVTGVKIVRPAIDDPTYPDDVSLTNGGIAGWGRRGMGDDASFAVVRQVMTMPNPFEISRYEFPFPPFLGFGRLEADPPGNDVRKGDSGGPLFRTLPTGERQVIGVLSGFFDDTWWADVAAPAARNFIVSNSLASSRVALSSAWYTRHGKDPANTWFGEADYTGTCDKARDRDCDLWYDEHDNCPFIANGDQAEATEGGAGKLCSKCPYDPDNDADGDGVCGPSAPGFPAPAYAAVDNCPVTPNKDQANCNELSERTLERKLLGDACDPVPCPKVTLEPGTVVIPSSQPIDPYLGIRGFGRVITDTYVPRPVLPSEINRRGPANTVSPGELQVATRFCQSDQAQDFRCTKKETIRDFQVDLVETLDRERPWHRVTQKAESSPNFLPVGADVSWPFTVAASQNGLERRKWDFTTDDARLVSLRLIPLPAGGLCTETGSVGTGTCLNGYLWHHARTDIGYTNEYSSSLYVGKRGDDGSDLANQFVPIAPDEAKMLVTKAIGKYRHVWWWQKLTDPLGPLLDDPRPSRHARPMGIDEGDSAVLIHDIGGGEDATDFLSPDVKASAEGRIIATSFEPAGTPHQLSKSVEGAIVADNGTKILDLLVNDEKTLKTGTEMGWHVESGESIDAPAPRTDFISFYSPMLGGVVVAGGKDAAGAPIGTVHLYRFDLGWIRIPTKFTNVRAAVFSPADGMLWVLDAASDTSMKLYRIDPLTLTSGRGASFVWNASTFPSHHLGLDANGKVLLVANTSSTNSKTMRLEVNPLDGKLIGTGLLQNEYRQSAPPIAAFGETSFIREDVQGRIVGVDRSHSVPSGATLNIAGMFK